MKKVWLGLTAMLLAALSLQAQALETKVVQRTPLIESIQLDGVIEAVRQATVSAQTSGQVRRVHFDVDDAVAPGQVIVELNDTEQQARLKQAEAGLREAQAGLEDARQNFARIEGIYQRELASRAQLDQARNQLNAAEARMSRAQAAVTEARQQLAYTRVVAPYGGIVTQRHVEEGASVSPGQALLSGISLEELRVVVALPQRYTASAREKREARVMLDTGRVLETDSMTFYPYADPATHTFRVRMNLKNPEGDLFPGMLVKVSIPVAERSALWVPAQSLVQRGELRAVYVLDAQERPRLRQVRVGSREGDRLEILSGISEGEILVLNPAGALAVMEASNE